MNDPADSEDAKLVAAVASGDQRAFEALYERYSSRLGSYLWRLLGRRDLAEEALNDTMMVLWRNAARFKGDGRVSSWLLGIAHKHALKALKRHGRSPPSNDSPASIEEQVPSAALGDDPLRSTAQRNLRRCLTVALNSLSTDHRAVIEMTFFEGRSCAEIATILDCPVNTVKTRMFHARKKLGARARELGLESAVELQESSS